MPGQNIKVPQVYTNLYWVLLEPLLIKLILNEISMSSSFSKESVTEYPSSSKRITQYSLIRRWNGIQRGYNDYRYSSVDSIIFKQCTGEDRKTHLALAGQGVCEHTFWWNRGPIYSFIQVILIFLFSPTDLPLQPCLLFVRDGATSDIVMAARSRRTRSSGLVLRVPTYGDRQVLAKPHRLGALSCIFTRKRAPMSHEGPQFVA